jgi:bacteriorhodopsin
LLRITFLSHLLLILEASEPLRKPIMDWQSIFHWVYVAGMAIGALHFWALSRDPRGVPQYEYLVAIFIPIWSGLAYMAMAIGQGKVEAAGQVAHYARYVDWIVTTPLLLLALSWTAMQFIRKDWVLIGFLMSTQVVVITTGLIADLSERDWVRYLWYISSHRMIIALSFT